MRNLICYLLVFLMPLSVWSMTPVEDADLSCVTGQSGVNINANLTMDINIGTMAWGDSDGITGPYNPWTTFAAGGYIGVNDFNITNLTIKARTADSYNYYSTLMLKPITIDVATSAAGIPSEAMPAGTTFVRFGLGALQVSLDDLAFDISLGARAGTGATAGTNTVVLDQSLGVFSLGKMDFYISPWSYVDIFSAKGVSTGNNSGICFAFDVTIDKLNMEYISWGDKDGLPAGNAIGGTSYWMAPGTYETAGYIGLNHITIGDNVHPSITLNGTVAIDVTTTSSGIYTYLDELWRGLDGTSAYHNQSLMTTIYNRLLTDLIADGYDIYDFGEVRMWLNMYYSLGLGSTAFTARPLTMVHISFPTDFNLNISQITAEVALADTPDFGGPTGNPDVLGDLYLQNLGIKVKQGSWVDIWAH